MAITATQILSLNFASNDDTGDSFRGLDDQADWSDAVSGLSCRARACCKPASVSFAPRDRSGHDETSEVR